jgi:hypothetical protein
MAIARGPNGVGADPAPRASGAASKIAADNVQRPPAQRALGRMRVAQLGNQERTPLGGMRALAA